MKTTLIIISFMLLVYASFCIYKSGTLDLGLRAKINQGAVILDVRTEREYNSGHIKGARNISLGTIRERYTELDSTKTYITYCSHGLRSVKVKYILMEKGFKNVYNGGSLADLQAVIDNR